jgi:hypothetical protein
MKKTDPSSSHRTANNEDVDPMLFSGVFVPSSAVTSSDRIYIATRAVQLEMVLFEFGSDSDDYDIPVNFIDAHSRSWPLSLGDWTDWIKYVNQDIGGDYSLVVSERPLDEHLQEELTEKRAGVWYAPRWYRRANNALRFGRVDVLVYLPPSSGQSDQIARLSVARELLLHYLPDPDHVPDEKHVKPDPFSKGLFDDLPYRGIT